MLIANRPFAHYQIALSWPWLLIGAGWATALAATLDGQDWLLNHHILIEGGRLPLPLAGLAFLLAWQLMTLTMMLPSSVPILRQFHELERVNGGGGLTSMAFLAGYAAVWTWFGAFAFCFDILVHGAIHQWTWLAWHPWMIAGATLLIAGSFQFAPLKRRCLAACRTSQNLLQYRDRPGTARAWTLGAEHGTMCLGAGWALMLVMFGLGVGNVVWMASLGGVMFLEKTSSLARYLVPVVGLVLLAWGALELIHPVWLPSFLTGLA
jgi:predicted metal-binding membrane protein